FAERPLRLGVLAAQREDGAHVEEPARQGAVLVPVRLLADHQTLAQQALGVVEMALMLAHQAEIVEQRADAPPVRPPQRRAEADGLAQRTLGALQVPEVELRRADGLQQLRARGRLIAQLARDARRRLLQQLAHRRLVLPVPRTGGVEDIDEELRHRLRLSARALRTEHADGSAGDAAENGEDDERAGDNASAVPPRELRG